MADDKPPTREQLVEAREAIVAQLDRMNQRVSSRAFRCRPEGLPDYGGLIPVLEEQLREIDALLNDGEPPDS